jgi:hypothetical protein
MSILAVLGKVSFLLYGQVKKVDSNAILLEEAVIQGNIFRKLRKLDIILRGRSGNRLFPFAAMGEYLLDRSLIFDKRNKAVQLNRCPAPDTCA